MKKPREQYKRISILLPLPLWERLDSYCNTKHPGIELPYSGLIRSAITDFLNLVEKKNENN